MEKKLNDIKLRITEIYENYEEKEIEFKNK